MIFVTVGTHEQPMNRLIHEIDRLIETGSIREEVFIQRGMRSISPKNCASEELISYPEMVRRVSDSRITVTHGGPGSIMMPLSLGKPPIVVPRQQRFGEHVDDHQVAFTKRLEVQKKVIAVYDIEMLEEKISNYAKLSGDLAGGFSNGAAKMLVENLERYCRTISVKQ